MSSNDAGKSRGVGLAGPVTLMLIIGALLWATGDRMRLFELAIYDFLQQQQSSLASDKVLVIDTSIGAEDDSLWNDSRLKAAIEQLNAGGAAAIVPTQPPPANTPLPDLRQLSKLIEFEKRGKNDADGAELLTAQLAGLRHQIESRAAMEAALVTGGNGILALTPTDPRQTEGLDECHRLAISPSADDGAELKDVVPAREFLTLPGGLCNGAAGAGYAGFRQDPDGVIRETALLVRSGGRVAPSLALSAAAAGRPVDVPANNQLQLAGESLTTGPEFRVLNRYYRTDGNQAFETLPLDAVLSGKIDPGTWTGRIVLLGPLATDAVYRTPVDTAMPATLLIATSLSNLLQNDYLLRPAWIGWSELLLLLALAVLFIILVPGMSLNAAALAALVLALMLLCAEAYLLLAHGIWTRLGTATVFAALGIPALCGIRILRGTAAGPLPMVTPQPAMGNLGMADELDLAFSVLRQQAPNDDTKERLYGIAVKHGRRKEYAKAERVLRYLASIDPTYRGVDEKLKRLSGARKQAEPQADVPMPVPVPKPKRSGSPNGGKGETLGRYEIDRILGRGAMATVYLGRDPKINRKVAIKTIALAEEFSEEDLQAAKEQFLREAESAGRLNHPNIIAIYDVGDEANVAYLAMEYFEGKSLNHFAQPGNLLPPRWVLELGARAAEALHYAHSQKVVHRDIKPANIMYDAASDDLKLTDFGIARLTDTSRTKTGIILGTPSYMSPEQLSGSAVTGQSDLYSLGITMYHLINGSPPFRADSIPKLMDKIVNEKHTPLSTIRDDVPPCADEIFDRLLAKNPEDRYPNGRALALALRECCSNFER